MHFAYSIMLMLSAPAYITPSPQRDIDAFIRFMWASERCPAFIINFEKTLEQVADLGRVLGWDDERTRDKILVETRVAQFEYQMDRMDFCVSVRNVFFSYDPRHLRKVGVID